MTQRLPEKENALAPFRAEIDAIDEAMVDLLAKRLDVVKRVVEVKRNSRMLLTGTSKRAPPAIGRSAAFTQAAPGKVPSTEHRRGRAPYFI